MKDQVKRRLLAEAAFCAALWLALVPPAHATVYTLTHPEDAVFGEDQTVMTVYEDTLYDLARNYSLGIRGADPRQSRHRSLAARRRQAGHHPRPAHPAARSARRDRRQPAGASAVLLPEAEARPAPASDHLSGEHRQDGLAHAARPDPRDREAKGPDLVSAGIGAQGARGGRRSAARKRSARAQTIRSAPMRCASPPATALI